ncbi:MAG TPA: hypothetical protein VK886_17375 [Vicinamibacterales bacterium]|nr:hypothetical protein [Vicinamibacterales bacterium]
MRRQVMCLVAAVFFGVLGGAIAAGIDEATVIAELTAADHEADEGYFSVGEGTTVLARPGSDLHRWLATHRGQKVRLVIEAARDDSTPPPGARPGSGRDTGEVSLTLRPAPPAFRSPLQ